MSETPLPLLTHIANRGLIHSVQYWEGRWSDRAYFALTPGREQAALAALIDALAPGDEIGLVYISSMDQYKFARRTETGYDVRRAGHGSVGSWQPASRAEAIQWLHTVADRNVAFDITAGAPLFVRPRRRSP